MEADGELSALAWWSSALSALAWWSSAPPWCAPVPSALFLWALVLSAQVWLSSVPFWWSSAPPWWAPVPFASPWWAAVCLLHPGGLQFRRFRPGFLLCWFFGPRPLHFRMDWLSVPPPSAPPPSWIV